jgi:hypothetical protein
VCQSGGAGSAGYLAEEAVAGRQTWLDGFARVELISEEMPENRTVRPVT